MKTKKIIAGVLAVLCVASMSVETTRFGLSPSMFGTYSMIASADSSYLYADTSIYTHEIDYVSRTDNGGNELLSWTADKYVFQLAEVTVSHIEYGADGSKETVVDDVSYHWAVKGYTGSELNPACSPSITVPDSVKITVSELGNEAGLPVSDTVTVVGESAFAGGKYKSFDLTGIQYIGEEAFSDCPYITVETIPSSVLFVGESAYEGSGLKTLTVNAYLPVIPARFCANTKLSEITFSNPEAIRIFDEYCFQNCVLKQNIIKANNWGITVGEGAFKGCTQIPELVLPDNVIAVEASAFEGCTALKTLKMGKNLGYINKNGFSGCTGLTEVTFNDKISGLGGGVFSDCTSLKAISGIPTTIKDWVEGNEEGTGYGFGNEMFAGCTSLISVELPSSLTTIPEGLCNGCTSLKSVNFGGNIKGISDRAFANCTNLQEITMADGVTDIGSRAFAECSSLRKLFFSDANSIGKEAFLGCTSLSEVRVGAEIWGTSVFSGCTGLKTAEIGLVDATEMPEGIVNGCTKLASFKYSSSNPIEIVGWGAFTGCESLPTVSFPDAVIIEANAFKDCTALKSICEGEIKAEDFGASCFENCTSLTQVVNSKASTIGASAFRNSGITSCTIEGTVGTTVVIDDSAFADCGVMQKASIVIPEDVQYSIGSGLFTDCTSLKSCTFTGSEIPEQMFSGCVLLETVTLPKATDVLDSAFEDCSSLKTITKPAYFTSVGDSAFANCSKITKTYTNSSTTFTGEEQYTGCGAITEALDLSTITEGMFTDCVSLKKVTYSDDVTVIPANAFSGCSQLSDITFKGIAEFGMNSMFNTAIKDLTVEACNKIDKGAFGSCRKLTSIDLEVSTIADSAFSDCIYLTTANVTTNSIDRNAFMNCVSLIKLAFPEVNGYDLVTIEDGAFLNCTLLKEVIVPASVETIGSEALGYPNGKADPMFLIVGEKGSVAETYADDNGLAFTLTSEYDPAKRQAAKKKPGDVDCNGIVSVADAIKMQKWLSNAEAYGCYADNMDVAEDGKINVFDMVALKRNLLKG